MFKNPLKYQSGGSLSQEQSAENQLINVIAEGLGAQPEQVRARLEQIKSNPKETQQLQQALQLMQKDKENGFKAILSLFAGKPQSAKFGGKIQDFICKHAKGGNLNGCGCKQEGGEIENKKSGYSVREQRYPNGQLAGRDEYANGMVRSSLNPNTTDEWYWMGEEGTPFAIEPESQRSRGPISGTKYVNQNYWNWINNQMDMARKYGTLDYKENGGKVLKGQHGLSSGRFNIPFGAYMKTYFNKRSTPNVGAATNRSFGYSTSDGNEYYLEDANVGRNSVDTWVNVTPQKDTIIMQKLPSDHINDLEDYQMEAIMQRMRPDIKRVNNKENGGKVEKAQDGSVLDYYSNKWSNDLARIKSGWNRFKESAPGKVWSAFMPNPNSGTGMLGAAAPIGKIKYIPEGIQSPYRWMPSREYIEDAINRGTEMDDLLFALKRDPKLGTNPAQMFGKEGHASKIKLNPAKEEVEQFVQKIYNKYNR